MCCASHRECAVLFSESQCTWSTGGNLTFPPVGPPFRPCVVWRPAARDAVLKLPRSPRRLRQRGGLNARCHSASQNIFCDVAAFAAIPSLGPCALGTHGLAPCVRDCTGIFCPCIWRLESLQGDSRPHRSGTMPPVLKRSGLSAVALAKVESTVTCQRVLPAEALAKEGQSWTESQPSRPGKALGEQDPTGASA